MMTDPIADLLTRIRNALRNRKASVSCPGSKLKVRSRVSRRTGVMAGSGGAVWKTWDERCFFSPAIGEFGGQRPARRGRRPGSRPHPG